MLKTCTALTVGIFERICCFDKVILMALTSSYLWKDLYTDVFYVMITYPISSNLCKKNYMQCFGFIILHLSEAATRNVLLLEMFSKFRKIHRQENSCGKVSFLKLQAEATTSDLSCIFSRRFLIYFISTEKRNKKRKIP